MSNDDDNTTLYWGLAFLGVLIVGTAIAAAAAPPPLNNNIMDTTPGQNKTASDGINNPLNLRNVAGNKWQGKITVPGAVFEQFATMWQGFRAGMINVMNVSKQTSSGSFNDTLPVLSPPSENDVPAYIDTVVKNSGIDPNANIISMAQTNPDQFKAMIKAMAMVEQGSSFVINDADVNAAYVSAAAEAGLQNA